MPGYFKNLSDRINKLDFADSTMAGRQMVQLISALKEVSILPSYRTIVGVVSFLARPFARVLIPLANSIPKVQEFHQLESSLQIRQFLDETYVILSHPDVVGE